MARSPLMTSLRRAYKVARASVKTGIPTDELVDIFQQRTSRRRLLYGGLALASAVGAVLSSGRDSVAFATIPKVLVVGAGIAGLTAAYRLKQAGVPFDIIEGRNRVGGRIQSLPNVGGTSVSVDVGGEFIDTSHTSMRSLAQELGLQTADLLAADEGLTRQTWYFEGRKIPETEIINYFIPLANKIEQDLAAIGDAPLSYKSYNQATAVLDNTSLADYLDSVDINPILRQMLRIAFTTELGREPEEQTSLNLLFLISTDTNTFEVYGESDEKYQIIGGNDQLPRLLAQSLANHIEIGTELEAINTRPDGRYKVSLRSGYRTFERTYERILLTLPFSTLRLVSLRVNLPPVKRRAIAQLGYGTNTKLITAYSKRVWRDRYNSTAAIFTDTGFQNTWEASRYQSGKSGVITDYTGGRQGLAISKGSPLSQAQILLPQLEQIFPGITKERQGNAIRTEWLKQEYTRGSYSCYLVGQVTSIGGSEGETVGNLFFAGEHCSQGAQGYMEGGCSTGETAAKEILRSLGLRSGRSVY
ncbi:flavin monoamine oxidase family protein [Iningainema tapete]|uniref:FAD-dependent oxidoreductase n=1 Tax=Iningainema tapete BLCC-T55 TaxID=2748662 RepID=A0A8J6XHH9_9CYAN|nr:NAD(P)/FAD-dependent oxidoreductase [Iningainema tapete]MBD2772692.1 FAD-dependent oxidoreductase [Iningainema tapete BLCC-T55]